MKLFVLSQGRAKLLGFEREGERRRRIIERKRETKGKKKRNR